MRWNVALGIPDWLFVLGSDAAQQIVLLWTWMPSIVILSQLCPHGVEATMYALLAGSANFANQLARSEGSFVLCALGVEPNGSPDESAQFEHLWIAVLLAAVGPCVPLVLLPFLIPDARQTDTLLKDGGSEKGATPPGATRRGGASDTAASSSLDEATAYGRMDEEETEDDML